ncbi:polysaccharide biosynthesis C-terminal domain-containing protein [Staphylococcus carnosus]|uniref:Uncharacterized protein n=1 Tax=Staphylococcus carnosus (strain TM300) TaxID=396513 RepID=B9DIM9_STACT|nr:polysaccharide biosynthesis C-terminal domain-containing protein [Staphylococcus carnosus]QPT03012.1 oligosaccharide flippase family protein [Staphylococcus carnosus]UQA68015.1 oligosaccharide flippase family protein [Staphylococcus carnosus]UTB77168.1 hypothetical protein A2I62_00620 [Staphylococcus carnosus]UTB86713.1 hypothetical protein A2I63_00610 [Staphylococcus carnosus]UTB89062.1 hypothetical protein A2I64_00615 [Staphylococcus carnosus]
MIKDSFYYFISKILPAVLSFGILFIYLANMNSKDYGVFSIVILTVGLINIVSSQWIRSGMLRYYNVDAKVINTSIAAQIILVVIIAIIASIVLIIIKIDILSTILIVVILINFIFNEFLNNYFRMIIQPKKVLMGNIIKNILYILPLLIYLFIYSGINLKMALLSFLIGLLSSNVYYLIYWKDQVNFSIDKVVLKKFLFYGVPLTVSFALGVLLQNIDKYMITYQLGAARNGNYSLVYDFVHNSLYMVMGALGMASLPRILKFPALQQQIKEFDKYVLILYVISYPMLGCFIVVSPELAQIFNSFGYKTSTLIVLIIILLTFVHGINSYLYGQAIQIMEKTKIIFIPSAVAVLLDIVLNLILLSKIGLVSAAISGLVSFLVSNGLLYILIVKKFPINFFPRKIWYLFIIMTITILLTMKINLGNDYLTLLIKGTLALFFQIIPIVLLIKKRIINF